MEVRFICMRSDLFLYGSIDICGSSIYMYAVRFIFVRFNLFFAVLKILYVTERHKSVLYCNNSIETFFIDLSSGIVFKPHFALRNYRK